MIVPHCGTCSCSQTWEIVSHHVVQALTLALGIVLGMVTTVWIVAATGGGQ